MNALRREAIRASKEILRKRIKETWEAFREFEEALQALERECMYYPDIVKYRRVLFTKLRLELDDFRLKLAFLLDNLEQ